MGQPAAKLGDRVQAVDSHIIQPPFPASPVLVPGHVFSGVINAELSSNVLIENKPAATVGSTAVNIPPHIPIGGSFVIPPTNQATIISGSATVLINGQPAARTGDTAQTCNDPLPQPVGTVIASGTVLIGG